MVQGWILWPVGEFVARRGLAAPAGAQPVQPEQQAQQVRRALQVLHALTQRFTAEFAIRPFILAHPDLVFATLARWAHDPSLHVRRLVSEGSRPRLPWGLQLKPLIADPGPTLPLLRALQDDASDYAVHHVKADGSTSPKVFKGWRVTLAPREARTLERRHAVRPITTRVYHPGRHRVVVQVNGQPVAEAAFALRV